MNQVLLKAAKDIAVKQKRIYYKGVVVEALVKELLMHMITCSISPLPNNPIHPLSHKLPLLLLHHLPHPHYHPHYMLLVLIRLLNLLYNLNF